MPTYEYECLKCAQHFDKFQSMLDAPLKKCPACGGKVKRLLGTGAGIIFKGQGFYQTDYRSSSYQSAAKADVSNTTTSDAAKTATTTTASAPPTSATATAGATKPAPASATKSGGGKKTSGAGRSGARK